MKVTFNMCDLKSILSIKAVKSEKNIHFLIIVGFGYQCLHYSKLNSNYANPFKSKQFNVRKEVC